MKPQVLIVEDVENQRESLLDILSEEGYDVFTAADGASAIRTTGEQLIDIAIVDIIIIAIIIVRVIIYTSPTGCAPHRKRKKISSSL